MASPQVSSVYCGNCASRSFPDHWVAFNYTSVVGRCTLCGTNVSANRGGCFTLETVIAQHQDLRIRFGQIQSENTRLARTISPWNPSVFCITHYSLSSDFRLFTQTSPHRLDLSRVEGYNRLFVVYTRLDSDASVRLVLSNDLVTKTLVFLSDSEEIRLRDFSSLNRSLHVLSQTSVWDSLKTLFAPVLSHVGPFVAPSVV